MDILYENIKRFRLSAGLSQREFGRQMGYGSHTMVARIEAGEVDLPYSKVLKAAEVLQVDPITLMGLDATTVALAALDDFAASLRARKEAKDGSL